MSTLNDLRSTLEEHADGLPDTERYVRPVAVRARIRTARRRRAGAVAAATAVVVLGAAAAVGALHSPRTVEPAGPAVVGIDVPTRIDVLGFPYDLDSTRSAGGGGSVDLAKATGSDRAVTLVGHDLGNGWATLYVDDQAVARVRGHEQIAVPYPVGAGDPQVRIKLQDTPASARAGVAVYQATGAPAPGVADGPVVFRDRVAGADLADAAFSPGDTAQATIRVTGRLDRLGIADYCRSDHKGLWVQVSVDGGGAIGGECRNEDLSDPGTGWGTLDDHTGGTHTIEVYVTRGAQGPRVGTGATVGVGAYSLPPAATRLLDFDIERTVEAAGRTWVLDRVVDADRATVDTADGDRLLGFLGAGKQVWTTYRGQHLDGQSSSMSTAYAAGGAGRMIDSVLLAGDRYDVRLHTARATDRGALLIYKPQ